MNRYEMQPDILATVLFLRGWLEHPYASDSELEEAVRRAQAFWELDTDGWAGPATERILMAPRVCGLPDHIEQVGALTKFPSKRVTVGVQDPITGFSLEQTREMVSLACSEWNKLSGFQASLITSGTPTVRLTVGRIDGAGRTLAWSELALLPQTTVKFDKDEPWKRGVGFVAAPNPYVDPLLTMLHEFGHSWGLPHAPGQGHLMSAIYDRSITLPGAWERAEMIARYDASENPDPPAPPVIPPRPGELIIAIPGARVIG